MKLGYQIFTAVFCVFFLQISSFAQDNYNQEARLQYHFSPPQNWINDPCGTVYFDGEYHLMYQYNPFGNQWGNMSWGHAVSTDLVHWDNLPLALGKDPLGDIFSGGAVVDVNNTAGFNTDESAAIVAVFTHASTTQKQSMAYSTDKGRTWTKYANNPIINNPGINDFRDPQVFWYMPQSKWVMTLALGNRIRIYSSFDLKNWKFESHFGETIGAHGGVWECPDLFSIRVEDTNEEKWVMMVSINPGGPAGGSATQYFVGDFDGTTFTLIEEFEQALNVSQNVPTGILFEDFEGNDYGTWIKTGNAFGNKPANGTLENQQAVTGYLGNGLVNTYLGGDGSQGSLTSSIFTIEKPFINFLIGGGAHVNSTEMRLLINGEKVIGTTGKEAEQLTWDSWDVSNWIGSEAQIQIVDFHTGGWGHINVDHILFSGEPAENTTMEGFWTDFGPDFYAGRSWENMSESSDYQRVWLAWMNNWTYADGLPTSPWRGSMSLPRAIKLKQLTQGLRVVQEPVESLQNLRKTHFSFGEKQSVEAANQFIIDNSIKGTSYEMKVTFSPNNTKSVGLSIRANILYETIIGYDAVKNQVFVDRSQSSQTNFEGNFREVFNAPLENTSLDITLHIFVDRSSVEVFVNEGERVITARIFPSLAADGLSFFQEGASDATVSSFDFWNLASIWETDTAIEKNEPDEFRLYPNPAKDVFWLDIPSSKNAILSLWSIDGQEIPLIYVTQISTTSLRIELPLSLKEGVYFLKMEEEGKSFCHKVVIGK
ncbi:MAG: GH32 C-terminal domain-containing protein [Chitinophagales bacterium]